MRRGPEPTPVERVMGIEQTRWDWYQLLARLSAAELAALLAAHYRQQGWQLGAAPVEDRPAALGTHGLELRLMRRGRLQLVWLWPMAAGAVEPPLVHQLTGRMLVQRAESGALVSSLPIDAAAQQVALGQQRLNWSMAAPCEAGWRACQSSSSGHCWKG